ncbi:hypothetical protein LTR10_007716 [Elasticomyces elasticus]|nr:hypothetical protein LTR10_007716 [Elasticomyces elasticus]KAK4970717.1 hypothetical protein LTR42_007693 [Elasticomyces elasticus]
MSTNGAKQKTVRRGQWGKRTGKHFPYHHQSDITETKDDKALGNSAYGAYGAYGSLLSNDARYARARTSIDGVRPPRRYIGDMPPDRDFFRKRDRVAESDDDARLLSTQPGALAQQRNKRTRIEPPKPPMLECGVCIESLLTDQFPKAIHSASSGADFARENTAWHVSHVCKDCWQQHIRFAVDSSTDGTIRCQECNTTLEEPDVKALATSDDYARYMDKLNLAFIKQCPEYRECPSAGCSYGYILSKDEGNIFNCQLCELMYCVDCEILMHSGRTCIEYQDEEAQKQREEAEETANTNWKEVNTKPCPECHVLIEKSTGCEHMTCFSCKFQFCWMCFAPYLGPEGIFRVGNHAHRNSCAFYFPVHPASRAVSIDSEVSIELGIMPAPGLEEEDGGATGSLLREIGRLAGLAPADEDNFGQTANRAISITSDEEANFQMVLNQSRAYGEGALEPNESELDAGSITSVQGEEDRDYDELEYPLGEGSMSPLFMPAEHTPQETRRTFPEESDTEVPAEPADMDDENEAVDAILEIPENPTPWWERERGTLGIWWTLPVPTPLRPPPVVDEDEQNLFGDL